MEHFHWSLSDADRLSFSLVTLRAVIEYLKGPEVEKLLPAAKEPQRRVSYIYPALNRASLNDYNFSSVGPITLI